MKIYLDIFFHFFFQVNKILDSIRSTLLKEYEQVSSVDKSDSTDKKIWLDKESLKAVKDKTNSFAISLPTLLKFENEFNFDKVENLFLKFKIHYLSR